MAKKSKRKAEKLRRKAQRTGFNPADYIGLPRPAPTDTTRRVFVAETWMDADEFQLVRIPALNTVGQAENRGNVEQTARDVISLHLGINDDTSFDVDIREIKDPDAAEPDIEEVIQSLVAEGLVTEVEPEVPTFDHAIYNERPVRWTVEEMRETGDWVIADAYTGLRAVCGMQADAVGFLGVLVEGGLLVDHMVWREPESMAEVFITAENEGHQFWAVWDDKRGFAIFDRFQRLIHPFDAISHDPAQNEHDAIKTAALFSTDPSELEECFEDDRDRHWFTLAEWLAPEPESVVETDIDEAVSASLEDSQRPVRVLLVSSRHWAWKGIVREVLQTYWNGVGNPPMTILTSGMPHGAESVAYEFLEAGVHGITHEVIPDNMITSENVDYAFAFVSNYSEGATKVVERLRVLEIPFHLIEETSAVVPDRWAGR